MGKRMTANLRQMQERQKDLRMTQLVPSQKAMLKRKAVVEVPPFSHLSNPS